MEKYSEYEETDYGDKRIGKRVVQMLEEKASDPQRSIHAFSRTTADSKAFYRLIGNQKFKEESLIERSRALCYQQIAESGVKTILVPQDTTALDYANQRHTSNLGFIGDIAEQRGLFMHSAIAVTEEGVPIGILYQKIWARAAETLGKTKDRKSKPIAEKESNKWLETMEASAKGCPAGVELIHICDREGDIYPFFSKAEELGQKFLVRNIHNRAMKNEAGEADHIIDHMDEAVRNPGLPSLGVHIPRDSHTHRKERDATLRVAYEAVTLKKSRATIDQVKDELKLYAICAKEIAVPEGCEGISWHLLTNIPVLSYADAVKALSRYTQRWKIERFHYALKEGCAVEKLQEDTAERMMKIIVMYSIVAINLINMQYMARTNPDLPCTVVFEDNEWRILYQYAMRTHTLPPKPPSMHDAIRMLARLGGFGGKPSDGEPGVKSIWLGVLKFSAVLDAAAFI